MLYTVPRLRQGSEYGVTPFGPSLSLPGLFVPKSGIKGMVNKQGCAPWLEFLLREQLAGLYVGKYILFACINIKFLL